MRKYLILILVGVATIAIFSKSAVAQSKSPTTAGILSAVLPGAGQLYNGEGTKGYYFMAIYASALALAIVTNPSTWEDAPEDPTGGFFDDLNPGGTASSTKLIFYGSAGAAAVTLLWSVLDAMSVAKDSATQSPRYSANLVPILEVNNKGALLTARIRF